MRAFLFLNGQIKELPPQRERWPGRWVVPIFQNRLVPAGPGKGLDHPMRSELELPRMPIVLPGGIEAVLYVSYHDREAAVAALRVAVPMRAFLYFPKGLEELPSTCMVDGEWPIVLDCERLPLAHGVTPIKFYRRIEYCSGAGIRVFIYARRGDRPIAAIDFDALEKLLG